MQESLRYRINLSFGFFSLKFRKFTYISCAFLTRKGPLAIYFARKSQDLRCKLLRLRGRQPKTQVIIQFLIISLWVMSSAQGSEVVVHTHQGESFVLEVDPQETVQLLFEKIIAMSEGYTRECTIEFPLEDRIERIAKRQGGTFGYARDFYSELTPQERADIRFILTTLANKSVFAIAKSKSALEAAGDRVDHVHPLRFLATVFSDEEMKVCIRNIRGKGWIWSEFSNGIKDSLKSETHIGNILDHHILQFGEEVGVSYQLIAPSLQQLQFDEFIDLLIIHIPRQGNPDRYDQ